ncbi:hypothetical protein [Kovacikia minuta]|uniref:hypothetical protein n=1 Tax=Kovacikia minuta TaxID=2931930 RepID=UPI0036F40240
MTGSPATLSTPSTGSSLVTTAQRTREQARHLATLPTAAKNMALEAIAQSLEAATADILAANAADCETGTGKRDFSLALRPSQAR